MSSRLSLRVLAVFVLFTLIIPLAMTIASASADDGDEPLPIPEKTEQNYPNLGSSLNQMVDKVAKGQLSAGEAAGEAVIYHEEAVAVTIYLSSNVAEVVNFLEDNGGSPRNVGEDYIEAYVPVILLGSLSEQPGVIRVREIVPPEPAYGAFTSQGVGVHGSTAWNDAGYSGQDVKVGVIDGGFEGFNNLMGAELPTTVEARCYTDIGIFSRSLTDCEFDGDHGTTVAETFIDTAPEVSLYIANPQTLGELRETVDWMVSEGVSVINHSVGWNFDGPGDGTSPFSNSPLNSVDRAVDAGIVWVNSAGNNAKRTWFGPYSNPDGDVWVNFQGIDETNTLEIPEGFSRFKVELRWEDSWDGATTDLDLVVFDDLLEEIVETGADLQAGRTGDVPHEVLVFTAFGLVPGDTDYSVSVFHADGGVPDWIQLKVSQIDASGLNLEYYTETGSITNPAESANPGMLAVGAAPWYDVHTVEPYSSRGPTPDGRIKPDIVGADCGATALAPLDRYDEGFCGTSQAAPHVAGMAALVRQRFPSYTPVEVASYLKTGADPRGDVPNNTWGHGFAWLPPSTRQDSPDRDALVALYRATGGDSWTNQANWLREDAPIALAGRYNWQGVTTDNQQPRHPLVPL